MAGLLFDAAARPDCAAIDRLANAAGGFAVIAREDHHGEAELLADGLGFVARGLMPAAPLALDRAGQVLGLPASFAPEGLALITIGPSAGLAGAGRLLPVVRVLAGLIEALGHLPGLVAVTWLPARLVMAPGWFSAAVTPWLNGGAFPALALAGLDRGPDHIASLGLGYFIGQEFTLAAKGDSLAEADLRVAVRLIDWLVAHGRIAAPAVAELAGYGTVELAPDGADHIRARRL